MKDKKGTKNGNFANLIRIKHVLSCKLAKL